MRPVAKFQFAAQNSQTEHSLARVLHRHQPANPLLFRLAPELRNWSSRCSSIARSEPDPHELGALSLDSRCAAAPAAVQDGHGSRAPLSIQLHSLKAGASSPHCYAAQNPAQILDPSSKQNFDWTDFLMREAEPRDACCVSRQPHARNVPTARDARHAIQPQPEFSGASWPPESQHRARQSPRGRPAQEKRLRSGTWRRVRTIESYSSLRRSASSSECLCGYGFV
jgi:hypothetical protein